MYLKVLYELQERHQVARVRDMAEGLGVSPGTVSAVLKKLKRAGLVNHDRYGVVEMTTTGQHVAECVLRRYRTLRALLTEVLGLEASTAETDACMLEHAVSPQVVNRLEAFLTWFRSQSIDLNGTLIRTELGPEYQRCQRCEIRGQCEAAAAAKAATKPEPEAPQEPNGSASV
jgi:DtxR family Mn-dependent transcriptional regulator